MLRSAVARAAAEVRGWLTGERADAVLNFVEEEAEAQAGDVVQAAEAAVEAARREPLLMLQTTDANLRSLGPPYVLPTGDLDMARRAVQVLLLTCQVAARAGALDAGRHVREVLRGAGAGGDVRHPGAVEGAALDMAGRHCVACSMLPSGGKGPSLGLTRRNSGRGSEIRSQPVRVGELYLVLDNNLLLLVTPDKHRLRRGEVRSVAPLQYTEALVDPQQPTRLRVSVRAREAVGCMRRGASASSVYSAPRTRSSGSGLGAGRGAAPGVEWWHVTLQFEGPEQCELARAHVMDHRRRIRNARAAALVVWVDKLAEAIEAAEEEERGAAEAVHEVLGTLVDAAAASGEG
eukprot:CAMPEP_0198424458 /NCGR_PEP_ID=MMETSP1452-20131203/3878_1 /TAXON_ID=1181717 /ORGANISM="Synchroma pusillum, Strain CCMP3072" /LENGTH=347 /DNA_ID=CAMNT_0044144799 /DNA_START=1 /DNA_END=1040 /DNA_ORIENTATION=-